MRKTARRKPAGDGVDRLWNRYFAARSVATRNNLVMHYASLVDAHAGRISRRLPNQVTEDEVRSAAFEGLIQAVEGFDPSHNTRFETFCQQRISGAVLDWLRSLDSQSRTIRTFEKQRSRVADILNSEIGGPPTPEEIAERMNLAPQRYERLSRISHMGRAVPFSTLDSDGNGRGDGINRPWEIGDMKAENPAATISREMLVSYITKGLTREERMVVVLYYYEELTMAEIGAVLDLSESRVSQIHKDILGRLRQRFGLDLAEELVG